MISEQDILAILKAFAIVGVGAILALVAWIVCSLLQGERNTARRAQSARRHHQSYHPRARRGR